MKNMSFFLTEQQFLDGSKDVTRRPGWLWLKPGDRFMGVRKGMGLRRGEKVVRLGPCECVSVRRERLYAITRDEVRREGFPEMTPAQFVKMFCEHNECLPEIEITRIEFRRVGS